MFTLFTFVIYYININILSGDQLACDSSPLFTQGEHSSLTAQNPAWAGSVVLGG